MINFNLISAFISICLIQNKMNNYSNNKPKSHGNTIVEYKQIKKNPDQDIINNECDYSNNCKTKNLSFISNNICTNV